MTDQDRAAQVYLTDDDKKLLSCPFCGASAKVFPHSHIDSNMDNSSEWCVVCQNPDGMCNARLPYEQSKESAIEAWNRRFHKQEQFRAGVEAMRVDIFEPFKAAEYISRMALWDHLESTAKQLKEKT